MDRYNEEFKGTPNARFEISDSLCGLPLRN